MRKNKRILIFTVILLVGFVGILGFLYWQTPKVSSITTFEQCAKAGYPIMEIYPERCSTPDGRTFINTLSTPQDIEVSGNLVCLPHKDTSGSITLECAYGIKDENGVYYGLKNMSMDDMNIPMENTVVVNGTLLQEPDSRYDIAGVIDVSSIRETSE